MAIDGSTLVILVLTAGGAFLFLGAFLGWRLGRSSANRRWEQRLPTLRREAVARSRSVVGGQVSEHLAPFLPGFPHRPSEARFLGSPVDFVVFRGLDRKAPTEVVFVEVKSGGSRLSTLQRRLRDVVESGRVRWQVYRVPDRPDLERLDRYLP